MTLVYDVCACELRVGEVEDDCDVEVPDTLYVLVDDSGMTVSTESTGYDHETVFRRDVHWMERMATSPEPGWAGSIARRFRRMIK